MIEFFLVFIGSLALFLVFLRRYRLLKKSEELKFSAQKKVSLLKKLSVKKKSVFADLGRTQKGIKSPRDALRRADAFFDSGDMETAERLYVQVLSLDSCSINACVKLGTIYIQKAFFAKAEAMLKQVLDIEPDHEAAKNLLASLPKDRS